jgi:hypothetical protein
VVARENLSRRLTDLLSARPSRKRPGPPGTPGAQRTAA